VFKIEASDSVLLAESLGLVFVDEESVLAEYVESDELPDSVLVAESVEVAAEELGGLWFEEEVEEELGELWFDEEVAVSVGV